MSILVISAFVGLCFIFVWYEYNRNMGEHKRWKEENHNHIAREEQLQNEARLTIENCRNELDRGFLVRVDEASNFVAETKFQEWKTIHEEEIRRDAIKRSHSVHVGHVVEQFLPFSNSFEFDPRDARFLGSPIDFVIFDGLSAGDLKQVVFLEVKTGRSQLTEREKKVKNVIDQKTVIWKHERLAGITLTEANDEDALIAPQEQIVA